MACLGWLLNLGFAGGKVVTAKTFILAASQGYVDGAVTAQSYLDGTTAAESYLDGAVAAQSEPN